MPAARIFVDEAAELEKPQKESWQDAADCATTDPEVFFPPKGRNVYAKPRSICLNCDVRIKCLEYALKNEGALHAGMRYGMFGAKSPVERHAEYIRRRDAKKTSQESQTL